MTPLVTIGIPSYKRPITLHRLLNLLLSQTYPNIEIIVSDNHSESSEIESTLKSFQDQDQRIEYYIQSENIGATRNFIFLLEKARGDYFMWLADDDYISSNYIEECMKLHALDSYAMVSGIGVYLDANGNTVSKDNYLNFNNNNPFHRTIKYLFFIKRNSIFYGVYNKKSLANLHFESYVSADITFIAQMCMLSKIGRTQDAHIFIAINGSTENREKMVKSMKYNKIESIFFELILAYNTTTNIFSNNQKLSNINWLKKYTYTLCFFIALCANLFFNSISKRISKLSRVLKKLLQ